MNDPFLIDERLSPDLVAIANARGHYATHVVFRGLRGAADHDLVSLARSEGFVLVTRNAKDFLALYAKEEIHPGLVIVIPGNIRRETQMDFFAKAFDVIEPMADLVNKVVQVFADGRVELHDLPARA